ncbi:hypothetical protein B0J11DRAFT_130754 [Dendryphion nanum]|uniref:SUZ domain-containing protein n=1 Tax=Dendryphion nanum TaxID=256645 RepID=A0A9P9D7K8_9PLEO|nr:hypothetical protein B0J11DRAFT_130754 [Dendryphion nanum]
MSFKNAVPDAWDDDWENVADKPENDNERNVPSDALKTSKAERKAKHAERNRELWESAENPNPVFLPRGQETAPFQSSFKPNVTVLSRKPKPQVLSRNDPTTGLAALNIEDDDDSEEERRKEAEKSFAERQARAEKEREEKLRKYQEAREKIFGSPAPSSGDSRNASPKPTARGRGRGRGGRDSQRSSNEQSPARSTVAGRQLYDPSYSAKPGYVQKKDSSTSRPGTPSEQRLPIREPRGPQSGRGFAPRGNHLNSGV